MLYTALLLNWVGNAIIAATAISKRAINALWTRFSARRKRARARGKPFLRRLKPCCGYHRARYAAVLQVLTVTASALLLVVIVLVTDSICCSQAPAGLQHLAHCVASGHVLPRVEHSGLPLRTRNSPEQHRLRTREGLPQKAAQPTQLPNAAQPSTAEVQQTVPCKPPPRPRSPPRLPHALPNHLERVLGAEQARLSLLRKAFTAAAKARLGPRMLRLPWRQRSWFQPP